MFRSFVCSPCAHIHTGQQCESYVCPANGASKKAWRDRLERTVRVGFRKESLTLFHAYMLERPDNIRFVWGYPFPKDIFDIELLTLIISHVYQIGLNVNHYSVIFLTSTVREKYTPRVLRFVHRMRSRFEQCQIEQAVRPCNGSPIHLLKTLDWIDFDAYLKVCLTCKLSSSPCVRLVRPQIESFIRQHCHFFPDRINIDDQIAGECQVEHNHEEFLLEPLAAPRLDNLYLAPARQQANADGNAEYMSALQEAVLPAAENLDPQFARAVVAGLTEYLVDTVNMASNDPRRVGLLFGKTNELFTYLQRYQG